MNKSTLEKTVQIGSLQIVSVQSARPDRTNKVPDSTKYQKEQIYQAEQSTG